MDAAPNSPPPRQEGGAVPMRDLRGRFFLSELTRRGVNDSKRLTPFHLSSHDGVSTIPNGRRLLIFFKETFALLGFPFRVFDAKYPQEYILSASEIYTWFTEARKVRVSSCILLPLLPDLLPPLLPVLPLLELEEAEVWSYPPP